MASGGAEGLEWQDTTSGGADGCRHGLDKKGSKGMEFGLRAKRMIIGMTAVLLIIGTAVTAFGASTIRSLNVIVSSSDGEGEIWEPSIRVTPSSCQLTEVSWSKEVEDWKPGKTVFGYLTITADEGRIFEATYKSSKCSISGADFRSASADDADPSVLHVTIKYTPSLQLGMTEEAGWSDEKKTIAKWKKVPYATMYEVRVYQNDTWVKTLELTGTSVDISPYIHQEGDYYYQVRAKGRTEEERRYLLTGEYVPSTDVLTVDSDTLGETGGRWMNYQEGKKYRTEEGTNPASQWMMIMGRWYAFDENGYVRTGWFYDEARAHWYYFDSQGEMQTGWLQLENTWYYLNPEGEMATGWLQANPGEWYYLNPDGTMAVDTVIEEVYVIGSDGKCQTSLPAGSNGN